MSLQSGSVTHFSPLDGFAEGAHRYQMHSYLGAWGFAAPSAWNTVPQDLCVTELKAQTLCSNITFSKSPSPLTSSTMSGPFSVSLFYHLVILLGSHEANTETECGLSDAFQGSDLEQGESRSRIGHKSVVSIACLSQVILNKGAFVLPSPLPLGV